MNQLHELINSLNNPADVIWKQNLEKVKEYIVTHNECPSIGRKKLLERYGVEYPIQHSMYRDPEAKKLGIWVRQQKIHYKNNDITSLINTNPEIRKLWEITINDPFYRQYLCFDKNEYWKHNLEKVKEYIRINGKIPSHQDNVYSAETKKLGIWLRRQIVDYKNDRMSTPEIKHLWEEFVN